jgi:aryl-alcohol dehydrogenase-like predicted oxidoreductase
VLGCDNQSDSDHAFVMFDHFFESGGNVFDTAFIYNNGKSDRYLGSWMKDRDIRDKVVILGKGAHTPHCEVLILPKCGHWSMIEQKEAFESSVLAFLKR